MDKRERLNIVEDGNNISIRPSYTYEPEVVGEPEKSLTDKQSTYASELMVQLTQGVGSVAENLKILRNLKRYDKEKFIDAILDSSLLITQELDNPLDKADNLNKNAIIRIKLEEMLHRTKKDDATTMKLGVDVINALRAGAFKNADYSHKLGVKKSVFENNDDNPRVISKRVDLNDD